jgi:hypothetical protein
VVSTKISHISEAASIHARIARPSVALEIGPSLGRPRVSPKSLETALDLREQLGDNGPARRAETRMTRSGPYEDILVTRRRRSFCGEMWRPWYAGSLLPSWWSIWGASQPPPWRMKRLRCTMAAPLGVVSRSQAPSLICRLCSLRRIKTSVHQQQLHRCC